jgi:hypothetical protein
MHLTSDNKFKKLVAERHSDVGARGGDITLIPLSLPA